MPHAIPTIDLAPLLAGGEGEKRRVAELVGGAAETYGFMQIVGHGIPPAVIADTLAAAAAFFAKPEAEKALVQEKRTNRGFQPMFDNAEPGEKPSSQEAFSMGHPVRPTDPELLALPFYAATPWPDQPGFREALEACYLALFGLGTTVLRAMAIHLGAAEDFFETASKDTYSNMRVAHYPPQARVQHITDIGVRAHADQGLITMLVQDMVGGLEVKGPDDAWLPVVPNAEAVVVNVGQLLTLWTNGRYRAALHRVFNRSGSERYSIPLFLHPNFHQVVDARDFAAPGEAIRFEPIVAGQRVYANFARQRKSWQEDRPAA